MSLSDCPECWDTPCVCGHQYKGLSTDILRHLKNEFYRIIAEREMEKVIQWKADDGKVYNSEIEALKAENAYWKAKAKLYKGLCETKQEEPQSSYGSSGGGGHD
jgi:hypothetical protein